MPSSIGSDAETSSVTSVVIRRIAQDRGQASVEFALVLPLVVVMALAVVTLGVAVRNELAVELAAREGARAAAVSASPTTAAAAAATRAVDLPIEVRATSDRATVTVVVTSTVDLHVPGLGAVIGSVRHTASATMAIEPP